MFFKIIHHIIDQKIKQLFLRCTYMYRQMIGPFVDFIVNY